MLWVIPLIVSLLTGVAIDIEPQAIGLVQIKLFLLNAGFAESRILVPVVAGDCAAHVRWLRLYLK